MTPRDRIHEAVEMAKAGNRFEARILIDEVLQKYPDNADAWLVKAQVVDDIGMAIQCMQQVVRLRPDDSKALTLLRRLEEKGKSSGRQAPRQVPTGQAVGRSHPKAPLVPPSKMPLVIGLSATIIVLICALVVIAAVSSRQRANQAAAEGDSAQHLGITITIPPVPTPRPRATTTPVPYVMDPETIGIAQTLRDLSIAPLDQGQWMLRTGLLEEMQPPSPKSYALGQTATFFVVIDQRLLEVDYQLLYQNDVVNMWVQNGFPVDQGDLQQAADTFARDIVPTMRDVFGQESSPGIDGSARLNVLNTVYLGMNVAGYFSPVDEYPREVYEFSNEMEGFYMSLTAGDVGSEEYMSTLAHEFQHMIRFHDDRNEDNWMDEGMAQLAERVVGYNAAFTHYNYLFDSRVPLDGWSQEFRDSYSHYGASYLFNLYVWERFGTDVIREIAHHPEGGLEAVDAVINTHGASVDDLFADWIVANYVNDTSVGDGRYGYEYEQLNPICPRTRLAETQVRQWENTLPQYSAQYIELEGEGEFTISFDGDTDVPLFDTNPYSGRYVWWSNRENRSVTSLSRAFDLSQVGTATLQYWTWFEIQDQRDAGYVMISADGGATWDIVEGRHTEREEQLAEYGLDYGHRYTGSSGGGSHGLWLNESIDLSPYAGQEVIVRFEYVTDTYYEGNGWAIDNIRIPEIDYLYDVETAEDGWAADGFVRTANRVPQKWTLSVIKYDGSTSVERLPINPDGSTTATITLGEARRATLVVGAMAPITGVEATYRLSIGGPGQMDSLRNPPGVLLQDNFESPCSTFYSFVLPDYAFGYQGGRYEIRIDVEDQTLWGYARQDFSDVVIDVDTYQITPQADSMTGVVCRYQDELNFYSFDIRNDGMFSILKMDDGYPTMLQDWTESGAIRTGEGAENHLRAACVGNRLSFNINDEQVAWLEDSSIHRGDLGFTAGTGEVPGIKVAFDNLIVTAP